MIVFAVDPGEHAGWALCNDGRVYSADAGDPPLLKGGVHAVVIERPVIYPGGEARANDQITLALNAGRWIERYHKHGNIYCVPARKWKGSINKTAHHAQVAAALAPDNVALWKSLKTHDARDAFALALWAHKMLTASSVSLLQYQVKV
jgi:hypothetical protein